MKLTRYHTRSGSIYEVREQRTGLGAGVILKVRRAKLGSAHDKKGVAHVARRLSDPAGAGTWRQLISHECYGTGYPALLKFGSGDYETLITSPVTMIKIVQEN